MDRGTDCRSMEQEERNMSELIDRKAAIRATWQEPSYTDPLNVLTEVRDRINSLPTIPAPRWHRVEEELPKDYGDYLGYANGEVMFLLFNPDAKDKWKWSACDAEGCFDVSMDEVTHWMPLPEPPKEDA